MSSQTFQIILPFSEWVQKHLAEIDSPDMDLKLDARAVVGECFQAGSLRYDGTYLWLTEGTGSGEFLQRAFSREGQLVSEQLVPALNWPEPAQVEILLRRVQWGTATQEVSKAQSGPNSMTARFRSGALEVELTIPPPPPPSLSRQETTVFVSDNLRLELTRLEEITHEIDPASGQSREIRRAIGGFLRDGRPVTVDYLERVWTGSVAHQTRVELRSESDVASLAWPSVSVPLPMTRVGPAHFESRAGSRRLRLTMPPTGTVSLLEDRLTDDWPASPEQRMEWDRVGLTQTNRPTGLEGGTAAFQVGEELVNVLYSGPLPNGKKLSFLASFYYGGKVLAIRRVRHRDGYTSDAEVSRAVVFDSSANYPIFSGRVHPLQKARDNTWSLRLKTAEEFDPATKLQWTTHEHLRIDLAASRMEITTEEESRSTA